jgi:hypothetical protein
MKNLASDAALTTKLEAAGRQGGWNIMRLLSRTATDVSPPNPRKPN